DKGSDKREGGKTMTNHQVINDRAVTNLANTGGDRWGDDDGRRPVNRHAGRRMRTASQPIMQVARAMPTFDATVVLRSAGGRTATCRRSDVVFSQDDVADSVFFILEGVVRLSVLSHGGKEGVVAMLESGDFFGESALAGRPGRLETATAVTPTTVLICPKEQMIRALRTDHAFSDCFIAHMLARNTRMEANLVDQLLNSIEKRLARMLLLLAHYGEPGQARRVPRISQTVLADMVGTTRSRVNFFMNAFKRRGFIKGNAVLTIDDSLLTVILQDETGEAPQRRAG
ncbi:MAG TPA: Crp/Fnr family transcriptional regulator, partial [Gemmatimonadaceae bacterium]